MGYGVEPRNLFLIQKLKSLLGSEFEMKDIRTAEKIMGMEIKRD